MFSVVSAALRGLSLALLLWVATHGAAKAQSDTTLHERLGVLAQDIVKRSTANGVKSLALLTFTVPDEGCTALSNYLVDGLTVSFYNLPDQPVQLVDRQNIEAIITEAGLGDILNPETGKQVGSIAGVDAFVIGSLVLSADAVQVTAKLLSTDARILGASVVSLPRTATLDDLLKQPVSAGVFCKNNQAAETSGSSSGSRAADDRPTLDPSKTIVGLGVAFNSQRATLSSDGKRATVRILVQNTNAKDVSILACNNFHISDTAAGGVYVGEVVGMSMLAEHSCEYYLDKWTTSSFRREFYSFASVLSPGATHAVTLVGIVNSDNEIALTGATVDAGGVFVLFDPANLDAYPSPITVGFADIPVEAPK